MYSFLSVDVSLFVGVGVVAGGASHCFGFLNSASIICVFYNIYIHNIGVVPTSIDAAVDSGDLVFGLTRLFLREDLIDYFEKLRQGKHLRVVRGALVIQSMWYG